MNKRNFLPFIIVIVFFFVVKLSVLFLGIDKLVYGEEGFQALITKQLIDGPILPFYDLPWNSYSGARLVIGLLMVPFFKLLGQNLISLKLVALLFSFTSLMLLYLFCKRFFNGKVAIITSLLFILSPPVFTRYSLITLGFHAESILFSILLIFVFFEIFFNDKKCNFHFTLLGLIGGFGVWFAYIFSITLVTCLIFWFLLDRRFFLRKNFLIFFIAFTFGFSPWIYYNLSHSFSGLYIGGKIIFPLFSTDHLIFSLAKLKNLLLNDIRNSFLFEDYISFGGKYLSAFYYLIFVISFVVLFWLNRWYLYLLVRRFIPLKRFQISPVSILKEIFFLIYIVIFFLIYSFSIFKLNPGDFLGYKYLFPLYPLIFILIALFLNKVQESEMKGKVFISWVPLIILLSTGLVSNIKFISFNNISIRSFNIDYAYSYKALGQRIGEKYGSEIKKCIDLINQVEEKYRFSLYEGLGFVISQQYGNDINKCIRLINQVDERHKPDVYRGILPAFILRRYKGDIDKCIGLINRVEERYRPFLYRGLGKYWIRCFIRDKYSIDKYINLINRVEERYRPFLYRDLGGQFINSRYSIDKYINLVNRVEERYRPYVYEGFGERVARISNWQFEGFVAHCISLIYWVEEGYKIDFYKGLGKGFRLRYIRPFDVDKQKIIIEREVENKYIPYVYEGIKNPF